MIIAIVNHKGGTGKTTTTLNLGRAISSLGNKVLLIDMDPQANLTYSLALSHKKPTIKEVLQGEVSFEDAIINAESIDIIPANIDLIRMEASDHLLLQKAITKSNDFDFILIDCPPSLSVLTLNALHACDQVLIPMQMDVFSIMGLIQIIQNIKEVNKTASKSIKISGVLPVMVDKRKKLTEEVMNHVKEKIDVKVFKSNIRVNVKAAEAPSFGQSVLDYAPQSNSAKDYLSAAKEYLTQNNKELKTI